MQRKMQLESGNGFLSGVKKQGLLIGLVVIIIVFSLTTSNFFSVSNLLQILQQSAIVAIAGCGITLVVIAGNLDLALGANITMSVLMSVKLHDILGPGPALLLGLLFCILSSLASGYLVGYLKIHSMIITLGMMSILGGIMLLYTGGQIARVDDAKNTWFSVFGRGTVGSIPVQVIIMIAVIILFEFILKKTAFGRKVQAVGGNTSAARYSGIDDKKTVLITFLLSGVMAWLAGIVMGSRTMQYQTEIAFGYEFDVLSAVILGGANLSGGSGSVVRTALGVLILSSLKNGFIMMGLPYHFQWIVQCVVTLIVVWADGISKRKEALA